MAITLASMTIRQGFDKFFSPHNFLPMLKRIVFASLKRPDLHGLLLRSFNYTMDGNNITGKFSNDGINSISSDDPKFDLS